MYAPYWAASQHDRDASQLATKASPTVGASQAPSDASLVGTSGSGTGTMPSGSASHPDPPPGLGSGAQGCKAEVCLSVGTFNLGIDQQMLKGSNLPDHEHNLRRITRNAMVSEGCHVLAFCEVGGHKLGLEAAGIEASDIVKGVLDKDRCIAASKQAYMAVWDQGDLEDARGIAVRLRTAPTSIGLRPDLAVKPQLVIYEFDVMAQEHPGKMGRLVLGGLHIRSNQKNSNKVSTKQAVTRLALQELEKRAERGALQPAVCILTGDPNLLPADCDPVVQPETGDTDEKKNWYTVSSSAGLRGDVAFIRGASSEHFEIPIGQSYQDPGIRNDVHDFFGVTLYMPLFQVASPSEDAQAAVQAPAPGGADEKVTEGQEPDPQTLLTDAPQPGPQAPTSATASPREKRCRRAKNLLDELRSWYDNREDTWEAGEEKAMDHLHRFLFRKVKHRLKEDKWWTPALQWTRPDNDPGYQVMVVSKEYVAKQVREIIEKRETWLSEEGHELDTRMNAEQRTAFLTYCKKEFHNRKDQKKLQERDREADALRRENHEKNLNLLMNRKKSRWDLHCQRLGGTRQMWLLLSFTGRFETKFFRDKEAPEKQEEAEIQAQKRATVNAANARARWRHAANLARKRTDGQDLTDKQIEEVKLYEEGSLLAKANELTLRSGHGTLRRPGDGSKLEIGGSTRGIVREILGDWEEPDPKHFLEGDAVADPEEKQREWESC